MAEFEDLMVRLNALDDQVSKCITEATQASTITWERNGNPSAVAVNATCKLCARKDPVL